MNRWTVALVLATALPGCDLHVAPDISLGETPPGGGGSGSVTAVLRPNASLLSVGETVTLTYATEPEVFVRDVVWTNEQPQTVSIETPLPACGTRCARITGLSSGIAQLRPYSMINGGKIVAASTILVR
jgi:hypothetical protein